MSLGAKLSLTFSELSRPARRWCVLLLSLMVSGCEEKPNLFWPRHVVVSGYIAQTAVAADFTGDGLPDVIVNGKGGQTILYVAPDWREIVIAPIHGNKFHPSHATHSEIMDVDGDGDLDYIGAYFNPGEIFWLERPAKPLEEPWARRLIDDQIHGVHGLIVGDIDGDRKPDLVANSSLPKGSFPDSLVWYTVPPRPREATHWNRYVFADRDAPGLSHYIGLGDVNGDGRIDAASAAKEGNWFAWWEAPSNPMRPWKKHEIASGQKGATHILMTDINRDGRVDFIAARGHGRGLVWYEAPSWKAHEISPSLKQPHSLAIGDINGDGHLDIVASFNGDRILAWFENDGQGNFSIHTIYKNQAAYDIRLVDMDRDGDLDILVAGDKSKNVVWYENRLQNDVESRKPF